MKVFFTLLFFGLGVFQGHAQKEELMPMKEWNYKYEVKSVEVSDEVTIAYVDEGAGESTLLFVHGLGSNLQAWNKTIETLEKSYRCIALDLPGYGKSSKKEYDFGMQFFAENVQDFIDALQLENVVLVGHSMGGQVAMHTVLNTEARIDKLVLMAPAGFETFETSEVEWFEKYVTPAFIKATPPNQIIRNFELNFYKMPEDARFMIEDRMKLKGTEEYDYYCNMIPQCVTAMLEEPVFASMPKIEIPTLILFGENDQLIPNKILHPQMTTLGIARLGTNEFPNGQLAIISEAGHFLQWEKSEVVNTKLLEFLK